MKRRCRDCAWWRVRKGCVNLAVIAEPKTVAIWPNSYEIYKHTDCDGFTEAVQGRLPMEAVNVQ